MYTGYMLPASTFQLVPYQLFSCSLAVVERDVWVRKPVVIAGFLSEDLVVKTIKTKSNFVQMK